jgi:hypothetical protein
MQLILSTSDQIQTQMVENMLKEAGIPCFSKHQGYGGYLKVYMGSSVYGIDTYVNDEDYDRAKEIVDVFLAAAPDESQDVEGQSDENAMDVGSESDVGDTEDTPVHAYHPGKTAIKVLVAIMLIALAAGFGFGLLKFISGITRSFCVF